MDRARVTLHRRWGFPQSFFSLQIEGSSRRCRRRDGGMGCPRRSRNWTNFSSPWARARVGHEVVDLPVGRLLLHYAEENPDEDVAALDDNTDAQLLRSSADSVECAISVELTKFDTSDFCAISQSR